MTGTVHNRAIAGELRRFVTSWQSANEAASTISSHRGDEYGRAYADGFQCALGNLSLRADELEAAAPPATIDAGYDGDDPPVGTVLFRDRRSAGFIEVVARETNGFWFFTNESSNYTVGDLVEFAAAHGPWAVLRWGTA